MPKGKVRKPNNYYERMVDFLWTVHKSSFTVADVFAQTKVPMNVIGNFLLRNFRRGHLTRTRTENARYTYRVVKLPVLHESKGAIAHAVWRVFSEATVRLEKRDVLAMVNGARAHKVLMGPVHNVVWRWHRKGILVKTGRGYSLKRALKKRPLTTV
jgi:hypothetical protein